MNPDKDLVWRPSARAREIMGKDLVSPVEVRDVLVECFSFAHGDPDIALLTIKKQARDISMDWDDPDRKSLEHLIEKLESVAKAFREPDVVRMNKQKIRALLDRCQCG